MSTDNEARVARTEVDDDFEDIDDDTEEHAWMWIYYDRRQDAYRAIRAADLLGISCCLRNRWEAGPDQTETRQWVVELRTRGCLPSANSSITRRVE
jgi:hypothetical protein